MISRARIVDMNYVIGIGSFGSIVKQLIEKLEGCKIDGYIDLNDFSEIEYFDGLPVVHVADIEKKSKLYVASNRNNIDWINKNYALHGELIWPYKIMKEAGDISRLGLSRDSITWSENKIVDECNRFLDRYEFYVIDRRRSLNLSSLDIVVTERCSLKCADCSNLMQYYKKPSSTAGNELIQSIDQILSVVKINEFRLIGGEPLLNKDLAAIIRHITLVSPESKIEIYTNGTILPSNELVSSCKENVTFCISDYGSLSRNIDDLCSLLGRAGVRYSREEELQWQDCGQIQPKNTIDVEKRYANCCVNKTFSLLNNVLYSCPFSANYHNLYAEMSLDSRNAIYLNKIKSQADLSRELESMIYSTSPLEACMFCKGRDYSVGYVPVAAQTKKILELPKT